MLKVITLIAVLGLAAIATSHAETYLGSDLGLDEEKSVLNLAPHFITIEEELTERVNNNIDANMIVAKKMLEERKQSGNSVRGELEALELLTSLEAAMSDCSLKSYEILARNYAAIRGVYWQVVRLDDIISDYRFRHYKQCRDEYKAKYEELAGNVAAEDREKLDKAFETLDVTDFGYPNGPEYQEVSLVSIDSIKATSDATKGFRSKVIRQIAEQLRGTEQFQKISKSVFPESALDIYLYKPCENFRNQLDSVLRPARFDAGSKIDDRDEFLHGNEAFFKDIITNRLCGSLLDQKDNLYNQLNTQWIYISDQL